jgi:hypothetical protein
MTANSPRLAADTELTLDMFSRAYLALALHYETSHPGEFARAQAMVDAFVEANLRLLAETNDATQEPGPYGVAARVRTLLADVEKEVAAISRPSDTTMN